MLPHFYLSIDGNKKIRVPWQFFVLLIAFMCSDSIFILLKRVTDGSFLFLRKTLVILFLLFLNSGAQIRCPQNRYTNHQSALDQRLKGTISQSFSVKKWVLILEICHEHFIHNESILKNKTWTKQKQLTNVCHLLRTNSKVTERRRNRGCWHHSGIFISYFYLTIWRNVINFKHATSISNYQSEFITSRNQLKYWIFYFQS